MTAKEDDDDYEVLSVALDALAKLSMRTDAVAQSADVARFVSAALGDPDPSVRSAAKALAKFLNDRRA